MTANMTVVATPSMDVSVAELGSGSTVVYLHDVFFDLVTADGLAPQFLEQVAASHQVLAPALPGFRDLKQLGEFSSVLDYVLLLRDLLSARRLDRPHVVGTGFGGWMAAELAVLYPDSLGTLTLVNSFGLRVEAHPIARFFDAAAPNALGGRKEIRELLFAEPDVAPGVELLPDFPDDETNERYFAHVHAAARIGWQPPAFYDPKLHDRLERIVVPTHVVWGSQNALVDPAHGKAYEAGVSGARLTMIEGAAHAVTVEQPEALAEAINDFLGEHDR